MKNFILSTLLFLGTLDVRASSEPEWPALPEGATETAVAFFNDCSNRPINLAPPESRNPISLRQGISLRVKGRGARPNTSVVLKVEIGPAGAEATPHKVDTLEVGTKSDRHGYFETRINPNLKKWRKVKDPSVLAAKVIWHEKGISAARGGGGSASMSIPHNKIGYRAKSPALCYWQTPTAIVSEYIYNTSPNADMYLKVEERLTSYNARRFGVGMGIGGYFTINHRGLGPYGPALSGYSNDYIAQTFTANWPAEIWVFTNFTDTKGTQSESKIGQQWVLHPLDGGFWGQRYSVARFEAEEYAPDPESSCGDWKLTQTGTLDVGISVETLYSVPKYLEGRPEEARDFMDQLTPPLNNCSPEIPGPRNFEIKKPEGDFIFFYPKS